MTDAFTDLYCVIGKPVRHSKSPLIHNTCFQRYGINAVYLAFEINDIEAAVSAIRQLKIKGVSVTIPYKSAVMPYLDEVDEDAGKIGAVNTIVAHNGILKGYNTDCRAAVTPLTRVTDIRHKTVCIIGAGGAAQAVAHGLYKEMPHLIIANRDVQKARLLADKVNAESIDLNCVDQINQQDIDILINTTSVGMFPETDAQPVPNTCLKPDMIVMDIVYTPVETTLLSQAKKIGCRTIDGLAMFIHQGAAQFRLWTGIDPDTDLMRTAIINGEKA